MKISHRHTSEGARRQIRQLLSVLLGGVICALIFGGALLYFYGPSGRYYISSVLLAPDMMPKLAYSDFNSKTGTNGKFVFDKTEFAYYDAEKKEFVRIPIGQHAYSQFYHEIQNDRSMSEAPQEILTNFSTPDLAVISLLVRTESNKEWQFSTKVFQEVQITESGDYYRVLLRQQNPTSEWAYFYHPGISKIARNLFIQSRL